MAKHVDTTGWSHVKLSLVYLDAMEALALAQGRLDRMTVQGNSPETRLSNFIAATKNLKDIIKKLTKDLGTLKSLSVIHFEWMTIHMKWKEDQINENIEEGSQGGYSKQLTAAIEFIKKNER